MRRVHGRAVGERVLRHGCVLTERATEAPKVSPGALSPSGRLWQEHCQAVGLVGKICLIYLQATCESVPVRLGHISMPDKAPECESFWRMVTNKTLPTAREGHKLLAGFEVADNVVVSVHCWAACKHLGDASRSASMALLPFTRSSSLCLAATTQT